MMSGKENNMMETHNGMVFFQQIDSVKKLISSYMSSFPNSKCNWLDICKEANMKFLGDHHACVCLHTVYKQISKFPRMWEALKKGTEEGLLDHISLKWFLESAFKGLQKIAAEMTYGDQMMEDLINLCVAKVLYGKQVCPKKKDFITICKGFRLRWQLVHCIRDIRNDKIPDGSLWTMPGPMIYNLDQEKELMATCYMPAMFLPNTDDDYSEPDLRKAAYLFSLKGSNFNNPDGPEYFWCEFAALIDEIKSNHKIRKKAEEIAIESSQKKSLSLWWESVWKRFYEETRVYAKDSAAMLKVFHLYPFIF